MKEMMGRHKHLVHNRWYNNFHSAALPCWDPGTQEILN